MCFNWFKECPPAGSTIKVTETGFKVKFCHSRKAIDQTYIIAIFIGFQIQSGISDPAYVWFPVNRDEESPLIDEDGVISDRSFRMEYTLLRDSYSTSLLGELV